MPPQATNGPAPAWLIDAAQQLDFDPSAATVIREPSGSGYGYWAGGHRVSYDDETGMFALYYRIRSPLEDGRGGRCSVALSNDGIVFDDVWTATKESFAANSLEVGHVLRCADEWRLYISYEPAGTTAWHIDVLRAPAPAALDAQSRRTVLDPHDYGLEFLKDPFVSVEDGRFEVLAAGSPRQQSIPSHRRFTAAPRDATLLGVSDDGLYFPELEYVFEAPCDDSWHGRRARLNSVIAWPPGWIATFDGGRTAYDNYEEWCGLAWSTDRRRYTRLAASDPWVRSPHGSVRYLQLLPFGQHLHCYFEYARADLSHDLRVAVLRGALAGRNK